VTGAERLYGLPGADILHADIATVWEVDIDPFREADQVGWVVEEWTVADPADSLPSPAMTVESAASWISDEWCEDPWPSTPPDEDARCLDLARQLHVAIAACVTYHQAAELVASHHIVLDAVTGEPTLDGQPLYRHIGAQA
jgi:hypothetical protein